jgi:hypothetical protein
MEDLNKSNLIAKFKKKKYELEDYIIFVDMKYTVNEISKLNI